MALDLPMTCGSIVHLALENAHNALLKKEKIEWAHVEQMLPGLWENALKEFPKEVPQEELAPFLQKSMDTTKWYVDTILHAEKEPTIGIEKKLMYPLNPRRKQWLIGFVDRISQPSETSIILHDYKTGSRKLSEKSLATDFQAGLYGAMAAHEYKPLSSIELRWHYLAHQKTVKITLDPEHARTSVQKADRIANQIESHKDAGLFPTKAGWQCGRCEYVSVCPAHKQK